MTKDNGFVDVFKLFDKIKLCNSRTRNLLIKGWRNVFKYWLSRINFNFSSCTYFIWAEKLPEIGKALGETLKEFKKSTKELTDDAFQEKEKKEKCKEFSS